MKNKDDVATLCGWAVIGTLLFGAFLHGKKKYRDGAKDATSKIIIEMQQIMLKGMGNKMEKES